MANTRSKRQTILLAALQLFMRHGYRAVSLDRIASESDTTKMTVYRHFANKDCLIEAVLAERDQSFRAALDNGINGYPCGLERLRAVFDWHDEWFAEKTFRGCMFMNAVAEFSGEQANIVAIANQHKKMIIHILAENLLALMADNKAAQLATQLNMLLDGAIVAAQISHSKSPAATAWQAAEKLIKLAAEASTN